MTKQEQIEVSRKFKVWARSEGLFQLGDLLEELEKTLKKELYPPALPIEKEVGQ